MAPDQSLGLGHCYQTFEQEQDYYSERWPLSISVCVRMRTGWGITKPRKHCWMPVLLAESDCWLGFTWFTAILGYCSESRLPPVGQGQSPEPCYSSKEYFTGWGKYSALQASEVTRVFRVFLSILCFSSSPTYLPTLPIFLLLKLPKKFMRFNICPMFLRSSLNFRWFKHFIFLSKYICMFNFNNLFIFF